MMYLPRVENSDRARAEIWKADADGVSSPMHALFFAIVATLVEGLKNLQSDFATPPVNLLTQISHQLTGSIDASRLSVVLMFPPFMHSYPRC